MKSQPSSAGFTNQSLKKQVFKYTPLVAAIGAAVAGLPAASAPSPTQPREVPPPARPLAAVPADGTPPYLVAAVASYLAGRVRWG